MNSSWLKSVWQSKYVRGSAIYTSISFIVSLLNYGFNFLVARYFPLASYGEYMTSLAYMAVLTVPLGVFNILLVKKIGSVATSQRSILTVGLEKRLIKFVIDKFWLFLGLISCLTGWLLYQTNLTTGSVLWIVAMMLISLVAVFYSAALQAHKYFWQVGSINIISSFIKITLIIVLIKFALNLTNLYIVILSSVLVATILSRKIVVKPVPNFRLQIVQHNFNLGRFLTKDYLLPLLSTLGVVGMLSIDVMVVKNIFSSSDVGLYAGLSLLGKIILFITAPLSTVAFAFFTGQESKNSSFKILGLNSLLIVLAGVVILISYLIIPNFIIMAVLGVKFISLAPLIYKAAIFGILYSLLNLYCQYALAKNHLMSLIPLLLTVVQTLTMFRFHQSFNQIMNINIGVSFIAFLVYTTWILRQLILNRYRNYNVFA